ncbi:MAG TPA: shikimate kinase [Pirellulaceae bacterium]|jgi:shikimate kinase
MNIFLVGYRGSGKTTVAAALAQRLGWKWVDADEELERKQNKTIKQIFADDGEAAFRDYEAAILSQIATGDQQIIALGGGVVLREANRNLLKERGKAVWLKAPAEVLLERINADATTAERRPNLTAQGGIAEIRTLLAQREPLYAAVADLEVEARSPPADIADTIVAELNLRPA